MMENNVVEQEMSLCFFEQVGETSGKIWLYLDDNGKVSTVELKKRLLLSNMVLYSAIGWLMREDKVIVEEVKGNVFVELK